MARQDRELAQTVAGVFLAKLMKRLWQGAFASTQITSRSHSSEFPLDACREAGHFGGLQTVDML